MKAQTALKAWSNTSSRLVCQLRMRIASHDMHGLIRRTLGAGLQSAQDNGHAATCMRDSFPLALTSFEPSCIVWLSPQLLQETPYGNRADKYTKHDVIH